MSIMEEPVVYLQNINSVYKIKAVKVKSCRFYFIHFHFLFLICLNFVDFMQAYQGDLLYIIQDHLSLLF